MAGDFRFSPRENRAAEIQWRPWGAEAFAEAEAEDRPIFLNLTADWCHFCHGMDEETFSATPVIRLLNERLLPVRVDADRLPHVRDRYISGGWPTNAFLTPAGDVLWSGTSVGDQRLMVVAEQVLDAWANRRAELLEEIERRQRALSAARSRRAAVGLVRREPADDVLTALQDSFDARNGGFGGEPKFPPGEAIEHLYIQAGAHGSDAWVEMADRTLDGILAGELRDPVEGGFFRYALQADWTEPRYEKLLGTNAELLQAYALGARVRGRDDWRAVAEETVAWVERTLALPGGLWAASQAADPDYYTADASAREAMAAPRIDATLFADANAAWIRALATAGAGLGEARWVSRAAEALEPLLDALSDADGELHHYRDDGGPPRVPGLATDLLEAAQACIALAQATGEPRFLRRARSLARTMEARLWQDDGGFLDFAADGPALGALRYPDRPFDVNAAAARLMVDLSLATGERKYRALAERILAVLSPLAGRYGPAAAGFASAVEEFFETPPRVILVGDPRDTAELRRAALALPLPDRRVWTLPEGGALGSRHFDPGAAPAAFLCDGQDATGPLRTPEELSAAAGA
ncbi:MAG TPA: DUF255 domain-containing protein [Longimicrobiales bacterium]|nr:DUF255 domain-containing protein [Longimicrobiales bacterium]